MNDCAFIIIGASGDLAKRKLLPALYHLIKRNVVTNYTIIGAARESTNAHAILTAAQTHIRLSEPDGHIDQEALDALQERFIYQQVDVTKEHDFTALVDLVNAQERTYKLSGNRVLYCATASQFYCPITRHAATSKLLEKQSSKTTPWHRIVYEKPFGHDLASAQAINECIRTYFDESQIYRVDHYLTKELVSNISLLRFTNAVLEPLWNHRYIDQVQIILSEQESIEGRGAYYDSHGALSDVVQNHMLELLALIGMEAPEKLTGEFIRDERAKVLEKVQIVDLLLGQYQGYRDEASVAKDSNTETFAIAQLNINNPRWAGVPFYLKTGKCLDKKETVIHIKFKQVDCLLSKNCPSDSNLLTIRIFPEASFILRLNAKKPGNSEEVTPIEMEFCHSCVYGEQNAQAHEVLLQEVIKGEQSVSVRFDEIEAAWRVTDAMHALERPRYVYAKGSLGPREAETFAHNHGMRWRS